MEGRPLDPVAVREARKRLATDLQYALGVRAPDVYPFHMYDIELLLAALDEGREASAPFAALSDDDPDPKRTKRLAFLPIVDLRRLAAWTEAVSEEKNDVR